MTEEKIRQRQSYINFKGLLDFGRNTLHIEDYNLEKYLYEIYQVMDKMGGFRCRRDSMYAYESIKLLLKDEDLEAHRYAKK